MRSTHRHGAAFGLSVALHAVALLGLPALAWWAAMRAPIAQDERRERTARAQRARNDGVHLMRMTLLAPVKPSEFQPAPRSPSPALAPPVEARVELKPAPSEPARPVAEARAAAPPLPKPLPSVAARLASAPVELKPLPRAAVERPASTSSVALASRSAPTVRPAPLGVTYAGREPDELAMSRAEDSLISDGDGFDAHDDSVDERPAPDRSRLVQERIARVARLVSPSVVLRAHAEGAARVALSVNRLGYVQALRLMQSSGSSLLDAEVESTVHFAEPFPLWEGWITVTVDYQRRE
jgi:TonB family protein